MGLHDIMNECKNWIRDNLSFNRVSHVSVFEITIRILGGLESAHALTGNNQLVFFVFFLAPIVIII
jgi:hypothetical protein